MRNQNDIPPRPSAPPQPVDPPCKHKFVFKGVVWSKIQSYHTPNRRQFEDSYFCERCLEVRYLNCRPDDNSFGPVPPGILQK